MKYFLLFISILLFGCQPKEDKPELDFVKIEIFPYLGGDPSNVYIDLKNKLLTFSSLQLLCVFEKECDESYEYQESEKPLDFVYINLNDGEMNILKSNFNNNFLNSIRENNQSLIDDPEKYEGIIFDGIIFEIDIVKENEIFSTDNYLILERKDEVKIYEVLKIIKKHTDSEFNKKYIDNISFYLE